MFFIDIFRHLTHWWGFTWRTRWASLVPTPGKGSAITKGQASSMPLPSVTVTEVTGRTRLVICGGMEAVNRGGRKKI